MSGLPTYHSARSNRRKKEGKTQTQATKFYNLKAITAVGYRVNSQKATAFRKWATEILQEYIVKGFAIKLRFGLQL